MDAKKDKEELKLLREAAKKIYQALNNLTNCQAIATLEAIKIDIMLNDKIVTITGKTGVVERKF